MIVQNQRQKCPDGGQHNYVIHTDANDTRVVEMSIHHVSCLVSKEESIQQQNALVYVDQSQPYRQVLGGTGV